MKDAHILCLVIILLLGIAHQASADPPETKKEKKQVSISMYDHEPSTVFINGVKAGRTPVTANVETGDIIRLGEYGDIVYIWNGKKKLVFEKRGDHSFVNGMPFGLELTREDRINVKIYGQPVQHIKFRRTGLVNPKKIGSKKIRKLTNMSSLQSLDLSPTDIGGEKLRHLKKLDALRWLRLSDTADNELKHLKDLTSLRSLDLQLTEVTDVGLRHLKGLTSLKSLHLANTNVGNKGLKHLKTLVSLQSLYLQSTEVTDAGLRHLKGLTSLKSLHLASTDVGNKGLRHLKTLDSLRSLYLSWTNVGNNGLRHLKELSSLRALDLGVTKVGDEGVRHLKDRTSLRSLDLQLTDVTDEGVRHLKKLTSLRSLDLSGTGTDVGDEGVKHLKDLSSLRELDLEATNVTDEGVRSLKHLSSLRSLDLRLTRVTDEGIKTLKKALPECEIRQPSSKEPRTWFQQNWHIILLIFAVIISFICMSTSRYGLTTEPDTISSEGWIPWGLRWGGMGLLSLSLLLVGTYYGLTWKWQSDFEEQIQQLKKEGHPHSVEALQKAYQERVPNQMDYSDWKLPESLQKTWDSIESSNEIPIVLEDWLKKTPEQRQIVAKHILELLKPQKSVLNKQIEKQIRPSERNFSRGPQEKVGHYISLYRQAKIFSYYALALIHKGKRKRALPIIRTLYRHAHVLYQEPSLFSYSISIAVTHFANQCVDVLLSQQTLPDDTLEVFEPISSETLKDDFLFDVEAEIVITAHIYRTYIKSGKKIADKSYLPWVPQGLFWLPAVNWIREYRELLHKLKKPYYEIKPYLKLKQERILPINSPDRLYRFADLLSVTTSHKFHYEDLNDAKAKLELLRLAIRAKLRSQKEGSDLTPIPKIDTSTDPYSGDPYKVKETKTHVILYSVGQNLTDDGGSIEEQERTGVPKDVVVKVKK